MSMSMKLDIILFGATGYTGRQAIEVLISIGKEKGVTWGVSARDKKKLTYLLKDISNRTGADVTNIPKFIADIKDENSLKEVASNAIAIVNCVGPFRFFGEPVVKACIASGTHCFDISGEPLFMEQIQLDYHKEAEEKGVYIVSGCAFNSLIPEMGIIHMMKTFKGELNSVETYLSTNYQGKAAKESMLHYGTWESNIHGLQHSHELKPIRNKLYKKPLPVFTPELKPRSPLHKSPIVNQWCLPFPDPDRSNALRTQHYLYYHEKQRPIQVETYIALGGFFKTFIVAIFGVIFALMTKVSFTRKLLLKYPSALSFGLVSYEGPSEEARANTLFTMTFHGEGWSEKKGIPEVHTEPLNKALITKLSGVDPTYGWTAKGVVLSVITAIKESNKMPSTGGVYSPGAAFFKTSLLDELVKHGLKAEIVTKN